MDTDTDMIFIWIRIRLCYACREKFYFEPTKCKDELVKKQADGGSNLQITAQHLKLPLILMAVAVVLAVAVGTVHVWEPNN